MADNSDNQPNQPVPCIPGGPCGPIGAGPGSFGSCLSWFILGLIIGALIGYLLCRLA